jgi:hypothetical protein
VYLTATPLTSRLEADVLTANTCTAGISADGTFTTQTVSINITSTKYPNAIVGSPVTINSIVISYIPYNSAASNHPLPTLYDTGGTIAAGTTKTFTVNVAPDMLKINMVNNMGFQLCSMDYWEYYADITFNGVENNSNKSFRFTQTVKVAFADFS